MIHLFQKGSPILTDDLSQKKALVSACSDQAIRAVGKKSLSRRLSALAAAQRLLIEGLGRTEIYYVSRDKDTSMPWHWYARGTDEPKIILCLFSSEDQAVEFQKEKQMKDTAFSGQVRPVPNGEFGNLFFWAKEMGMDGIMLDVIRDPVWLTIETIEPKVSIPKLENRSLNQYLLCSMDVNGEGMDVDLKKSIRNELHEAPVVAVRIGDEFLNRTCESGKELLVFTTAIGAMAWLDTHNISRYTLQIMKGNHLLISKEWIS